MFRVAIVVVAFSTVGWLRPVGVRAQARPADPEELIRRGNELRQQGRNEEALPLFQAAYAASRTPRTAGQLGLSEMTVGYWVDAEAHLAEALEFPRHPWVARNIEGLRDMLRKARAKIADVVVDGTPLGAEVRVNGRPVGALPLNKPLRLGEGRIEVELVAPNHKTETRSLSVKGGEKRTVSIDLVTVGPAPMAVAEQAAAPPVAPSTERRPIPSGDRPVPFIPYSNSPASATTGGEPSEGRPSKWLALTTAGAGLVAIGFGAVELYRWRHAENAFNDHLGPAQGSPATSQHDCGEQDPMRGGPGCQSLHDDAVRARAWAIVGLAAGGALAVTSVVLWPSHRSVPPEQRVSCAFDPTSPGVACQWPF